MADPYTGATSSAEQIRANYEMYKDKFVNKDKDLINQETFLNLLVAEMANQDPLEPTSNTEFISQLATFSQMQYMQQSSTYSMATYASSLVGKIATGTKMDGTDLVMKTGVVQRVTKSGDTYWVNIDGVDFDISKITSVQDNNSSAGSGFQSSSLGDSIARAAMMIGMFATVKTPTGNVEGFIDAISVKDGKIQLLINGRNYALEDVTEVTYATIIYPDDTEGEDGENSDAVDGVDGDTVDGVDGDKGTGDELTDGTEPDEGSDDVPDLEEE